MKLGQLISFLDAAAIPEQYRAAYQQIVGTLQADALPMPIATVRDVLAKSSAVRWGRLRGAPGGRFTTSPSRGRPRRPRSVGPTRHGSPPAVEAAGLCVSCDHPVDKRSGSGDNRKGSGITLGTTKTPLDGRRAQVHPRLTAAKRSGTEPGGDRRLRPTENHLGKHHHRRCGGTDLPTATSARRKPHARSGSRQGPGATPTTSGS